MLDMTRIAENAYFIQQREQGYADRSIASLVREICSYTDGATFSGKKDALVNIGGFLAVNDKEIFEEASNLVVVYEGLHTYGGLAGRDMEAMAVGIKESVHDEHMKARIGQVMYLGENYRKPESRSYCRLEARHLHRCQTLSSAPDAGSVSCTGSGGGIVR